MIDLMNWYSYDKICWKHARDMLCDCYDLQYAMICAWGGLLCLKTCKCYDMIYLWHEWYDWHAKRRTSMKYNPDIRVQDTINDMIWYEGRR